MTLDSLLKQLRSVRKLDQLPYYLYTIQDPRNPGRRMVNRKYLLMKFDVPENELYRKTKYLFWPSVPEYDDFVNKKFKQDWVEQHKNVHWNVEAIFRFNKEIVNPQQVAKAMRK